MRLFLSGVIFALAASVASQSVNKPTKPGFVTTKGTQFVLDGKPYAFVGANSYWLPLLLTQDDIEKTFSGMQRAGVKVLRTWGFNAVNATEVPGAKKSGLTYYQIWDGPEWKLNDGPQGLKRLDNIVNTAGKYGIKLILAFTNNWVGYGGSELYVNWIAGANATHDVFYTNPKIIQSYQRYVRTIVNRYKSSGNIFAWELMNEARCSGDLPAGSGCIPGSGTIHKWYKEQAAFVKSLDPYHMVTAGGEGQYYITDPKAMCYTLKCVDDYTFNGAAGEDFENDLKIDDLDFGGYHAYPEYWYAPQNHPGTGWSVEEWGLFWIKKHAETAKKIGKPLILEEFGVSGLQNKTQIYPSWVKAALDTYHGGIMPWQFGQLGLTEGNRNIKYADDIWQGASPNDGFAIYPNQTAAWNIFVDAARVQNMRSR